MVPQEGRQGRGVGVRVSGVKVSRVKSVVFSTTDRLDKRHSSLSSSLLLSVSAFKPSLIVFSLNLSRRLIF